MPPHGSGSPGPVPGRRPWPRCGWPPPRACWHFNGRNHGIEIGLLHRLVGAELLDVRPAENAPPAPVMTMALTAASCCALSRPSTMPWRVERPRPLTGGLAKRDHGDAAVDFVFSGHAVVPWKVEKNGRAIFIVGADRALTKGLCLYWDKCPAQAIPQQTALVIRPPLGLRIPARRQTVMKQPRVPHSPVCAKVDSWPKLQNTRCQSGHVQLESVVKL